MKTDPRPRAPAPATDDNSTGARYLRLRRAILDDAKQLPPAQVFRKADGTVAGVMQIRRAQRVEDI